MRGTNNYCWGCGHPLPEISPEDLIKFDKRTAPHFNGHRHQVDLGAYTGKEGEPR